VGKVQILERFKAVLRAKTMLVREVASVPLASHYPRPRIADEMSEYRLRVTGQ